MTSLSHTQCTTLPRKSPSCLAPSLLSKCRHKESLLDSSHSMRASDLRLRRHFPSGEIFARDIFHVNQNSPLQFVRRAHLIQFFTEISFWPTTVYFNNCLNQNQNKILLSYWLSLAADSALIIRVVKQNQTTVYQFCYLISWLYFVNTSPR